VVSAAIVSDQHILGEAGFVTRQGHMERLLPVIDQVLSGLGMTIQDIDAFAVAIGPGSFTSLRVGIATAKALAHTAGKPLAGVPTLDALAQGLYGTPGLVCPLLTSRAQEVYASFYASVQCCSRPGAGRMKRLSGYLAVDPQRLADRLQGGLRSRVTFTGEGALGCWDVLWEALGDRAVLAEPAQLWPRAALVATMGLDAMEHGLVDTRLAAVRALYVKPPAIRSK